MSTIHAPVTRCRECWIVEPERRTVELLAISGEGIDSAGVFAEGTLLTSRAFPDLQVVVTEIFAE